MLTYPYRDIKKRNIKSQIKELYKYIVFFKGLAIDATHQTLKITEMKETLTIRIVPMKCREKWIKNHNCEHFSVINQMIPPGAASKRQIPS